MLKRKFLFLGLPCVVRYPRPCEQAPSSICPFNPFGFPKLRVGYPANPSFLHPVMFSSFYRPFATLLQFRLVYCSCSYGLLALRPCMLHKHQPCALCVHSMFGVMPEIRVLSLWLLFICSSWSGLEKTLQTTLFFLILALVCLYLTVLKWLFLVGKMKFYESFASKLVVSLSNIRPRWLNLS